MISLRRVYVSLLTVGVLSYMALHPAAAAGPNDPYFSSKGSWGQKHDDQWAIKRLGFTKDRKSAWRLPPAKNRNTANGTVFRPVQSAPPAANDAIVSRKHSAFVTGRIMYADPE